MNGHNGHTHEEDDTYSPGCAENVMLNAEERWANLTSLNDIRNTRGGLGLGFL